MFIFNCNYLWLFQRCFSLAGKTINRCLYNLFSPVFFCIVSSSIAVAQTPIQPPDQTSCETFEARFKYASTLEPPLLQDLRLQAIAQGKDAGEHIDTFVKNLCGDHNGSHNENAFTFTPCEPSEPHCKIEAVYVEHTSVWCEADWDSICEGDEYFSVDEGMQICKFEYIIDEGRKSEARVKPTGWITDESGRTNRFTKYKIELYAEGSRLFLDRWGTKVHVSDIALYAVPASFTDDERRAAGCLIPTRPFTEETSPTPVLAGGASIVTGENISDDVRRYKLTIINPHQGKSVTSYKVEKWDSFHKEWRNKEVGTVSLNGGDKWTKEFFDYDALRWNHTSRNIE